ncbi:hypothetical protein RM549_17425 [Salegentibacter sp. F188]|uniref:Uncharacterized protein n=1 Tax=Autumnicola patrickiae TaxID=3075591 RepID=A0ABU3E6G6_9FLAO|nr:hypothetical protein [Salegentibacter sp. F188]MDT0691576.1 hypothetical protein [Salegentibacter sp. F188]
MEEKILKRLLKRGETDFMIFRGDLPFTGEFKPAYENLKKLKLIETRSVNNESKVSLTIDGLDANKKGLKNWVEEKVYTEIKNREFVLTKETTALELGVLRDLEDKGFVYEYDKRKYKVTSNKPLNLKKEKIPQQTPKIEKPNKPKRKINWNKIFQTLGYFLTLAVALLGIIEYKFHYVSTFWEWIIENI